MPLSTAKQLSSSKGKGKVISEYSDKSSKGKKKYNGASNRLTRKPKK